MNDNQAAARFHRAKSFWFEIAEPYAPAAPLKGDVKADICIIGGGIAGISTAYHLKKADPGLHVVLLEQEVIGFGASGRNAGQLLVSFGGGSLANLVRTYGADNLSAAFRYVERGIGAIENLQAEEGFSCDYAATGYLKTALRIEGEREIDGSLAIFDKIGQAGHYQRLSADAVEAELHSPYLGAALYDRRGGQFNPLSFLRGLRNAAIRRGVEIFENSPVVGIERPASGALVVHTGAGRVEAGKIVLGTNAYTHLLPDLDGLRLHRQQTPLMVKATVTEPLTTAQWEEAGWPRRSGVNVLSQLFFSFAPTADGRLLYVGGYDTSAPWDRSLGPEIAWRLKESDHLSAFFPHLKGLKVAQTWGGPISATADWIAHVGETADPRILFAVGCWGHGMALSLQHGRTLADIALGRTSENTDLFFVQRRKKAWPNRALSALLATSIISKRRRGNRKLGRQLDPPLHF